MTVRSTQKIGLHSVLLAVSCIQALERWERRLTSFSQNINLIWQYTILPDKIWSVRSFELNKFYTDWLRVIAEYLHW